MLRCDCYRKGNMNPILNLVPSIRPIKYLRQIPEIEGKGGYIEKVSRYFVDDCWISGLQILIWILNLNV